MKKYTASFCPGHKNSVFYISYTHVKPDCGPCTHYMLTLPVASLRPFLKKPGSPVFSQ